MKVKTYDLIVYDIGDIIDISSLKKTNSVKAGLYKSKRAIVLDVNGRKDGRYSYKVFADNGSVYIMKPEEMGNEKYIDHVDMSKFYENVEEKQK